MKRSDFRLRNIRQEDLATILMWRNSERIRNNMYNDHVISREEHLRWFHNLQTGNNSVYKVFEYADKPIGLISFVNIDNKNGLCFWGFYIGEENAPKGAGTIMGFLGLEHAFEAAGIRKILGEVFAFNEESIYFHTILGFKKEGLFIKHILKEEVYENIIRFALLREDWLNNKNDLADNLLGDILHE